MGDSKTSLVNTDIGLMPDYWDIVEVNKLGDIVTGTTPKTNVPEYYDGAYMFIAPGDINDNKYVKKTQKYLSDKGLKVSRPLTQNTVLVVCIGATIGKVAITQAENSTTNQQINAVIPNQKVNADYLYYAFKYRSPYLPALAGRAAIPIVNKSNFGRFLIPLPPLPEQKTIAHTLQTIQKAKETRQRELELERERKAALMQYLFTHGTRNESRKQTEIGENPESWQVVKLENLLREPLKNGHSALATNSQEGIRTLTLTAVTKNNFSIENTKLTQANPDKVKNLWLEAGDILIERANTYEMVGLAALYEGDKNFAIYPDLMIRIRVKEEEIYTKFLVEFLLTPVCRAYFKKNASGTASSMPKIDQGAIRRINIPLPLYQEQREIVEIAKNCDRKIQALEKEIALIDELFHAMLEQLMTGKISTQPLTEIYV